MPTVHQRWWVQQTWSCRFDISLSHRGGATAQCRAVFNREARRFLTENVPLPRQKWFRREQDTGADEHNLPQPNWKRIAKTPNRIRGKSERHHYHPRHQIPVHASMPDGPENHETCDHHEHGGQIFAENMYPGCRVKGQDDEREPSHHLPAKLTADDVEHEE